MRQSIILHAGRAISETGRLILNDYNQKTELSADDATAPFFGCLMFVWIVFCVLMSRVYRSGQVVRACIDCIQFERFIHGICDVVPFVGRDKDSVIIGNFLLEIQIVLRIAHHAQTVPFFDADELVDAMVDFQADVIVRMDGHDGHLQFFAGPDGCAVVLIL